MKDCLFCKIIDGKIPSKKIYEDELLIVIMDVNPNENGHLLVIPKKHYSDFTELDNNILIHINTIANKMVKKIYNNLNATGVKLVVNYGSYQEIKHYHLHLIPAYKEKQKIVDLDITYNKLKTTN